MAAGNPSLRLVNDTVIRRQYTKNLFLFFSSGARRVNGTVLHSRPMRPIFTVMGCAAAVWAPKADVAFEKDMT